MLRSTGKIRLKFLTLTIRNTWDTEADLRLLHKAMRNLIRSKFGRKYIRRGTWVIEWTAHPYKKVHVHIHAMIETRYYKIPFKSLKKNWEKVTGGEGKFVKVSAIKGKVDKIVKYMSKYMIKDDWIHPAWKTLSDLFKGKQMMGVWGKFLGGKRTTANILI